MTESEKAGRMPRSLKEVGWGNSGWKDEHKGWGTAFIWAGCWAVILWLFLVIALSAPL